MRKVKRKTKKSVKIFLILVLFVIVVAICCKLTFKEKEVVKDSLIGKWTTDGNTIYQFDKDNIGSLIVPLSNYEFSYKIDGDKLFIDFKNEKSEDSTYTYSLEDNKLTLKGKIGTFIFKRVKEKK